MRVEIDIPKPPPDNTPAMTMAELTARRAGLPAMWPPRPDVTPEQAAAVPATTVPTEPTDAPPATGPGLCEHGQTEGECFRGGCHGRPTDVEVKPLGGDDAPVESPPASRKGSKGSKG